ncbi:hypothetical protein HYU10_04390 [Candidatus Woesearchaeota archaeon]|nr:hypothetical protein [Candidatus Woesearchaeota archaeon]MBI2660843.1 hypothetical protein [Candidatus Woesearchaeota archaeon]
MRLLIEGGLDAAAEHYAYLAQLARRAAHHDISEYIGREQNMAEAVKGTKLAFQTNASMYQYMRDSLGARTIEEAHGKLAHGQVPQHIVEVWLDDGYITRHDALGAIRAGYPMLDVNGLLLRNLLG